jgi:acyl-CoA synthetase (AMP-forming)/AMP-acid ligase II
VAVNAPDSGTPAAPCRNCGGALPESARFCPHCGQETNLRPPTVGEFVQQFGGAYVATEGALWRTLKLLLLKPGALTAEYLAGRRKHYVLPLRLYLTVSLVVLLALRVHGGFVEVRTDGVSISPGASGRIDLGFGRAGLDQGRFFCEGFPAAMCRRFERRLSSNPEVLAAEMEGVATRFFANLGGAMFLLLPVFAGAMHLAYRNRRLHYTEHLVFALHVHAFWFVAVALVLPDVPPLVGVASCAIPIYTMLAMRRVFGGRWWPRLLRALFVSTVYGAALVLVLAGAALWSLLF